MARAHVLILGGGFAGVEAARALRPALRAGRCRITVIDHEAVSVMIPALADYAAGLLDDTYITAPLADRLPTGCDLMRDMVTAVDAAARTVRTASGASLSYDYLVLALGSASAAAPCALACDAIHTLTTYADARRLRQAFLELLDAPGEGSVLISGAGYTGIELAVSLVRGAATRGKRITVTLTEQRNAILSFVDAAGQARVRRTLERHGISLRMDCKIEAFDGQTAQLSDGATLEPGLFCLTEGTVAPVQPEGVTEALGDGRLRVTSTLSLPEQPAVFAAGDAAVLEADGQIIRKAVNPAIYSGRHAGRNIARLLRGASPRPFRPVDLGWVIPLGDDSVGKLFDRIPLRGRTGLRMHYMMCGVRNYSFRNLLHFVRHAVRAGRLVDVKEEVT